MDVRVLATATCIKGGAEGQHRNIIALLEQSGDLAQPLYVVTFQIHDGRKLKLTHWSRTDFDQHEARALYDQACRDFIDVDVEPPQCIVPGCVNPRAAGGACKCEAHEATAAADFAACLRGEP